jgi:inosine-uridine nucleoside N-ribohydrolase
LPRLLLLALSLLAAPAAFAHGGKPATPGDRVPVIIDTDMALDDVAAILAVAAAPTVEIVALTTVGGAARARVGAENAARLLAFVGAPGVPVAVGADPALPAPPWRGASESLGGVGLPALAAPPRTDAVALLRETLARADDRSVVVLALGPLTNLQQLLAAAPASARKIKAVYLLGGPGERPWNLTADPGAARAVLAAGLRVIALPDSLARAVTVPAEAAARLGRSPSPGARWLARVWLGARHALLEDAALVAAFLGPDAVPGAKPIGLALDPKGTLVAAPGGTVTVIDALDAARAGRLLEALWLETPPDQPEATKDGGPPLRRVTAFHGHLGPYVVLGYRMGLLARARTGTGGYFDITAEPTTRGTPPESCFVDGVQLGSGATTGKGNLRPAVKDGPPRATFVGTNGRRVTLELAPTLVPWIRASIAQHGVGPTGLWIFAAPTETLFVTAPAGAR